MVTQIPGSKGGDGSAEKGDWMKDALETVIEGLIGERDSLNQVIQFLTERARASRSDPIKVPDPSPASTAVATLSSEPAIKIQETVFFGMKLWAAAEKLLGMIGHPMKLSEMTVLLRMGGLNQRTVSLESNLSTVMGKKPDIFIRTAPGTWTLTRNGHD